jgi:hypothetical protein
MTDDEKKISKTQSVSITLASILSAIINGIVGYIAVYFFKPVWEKSLNGGMVKRNNYEREISKRNTGCRKNHIILC